MAYTVRTVLDTWLKINTAQGSVLSADQKQFINAGVTLPISGFELIGNAHIKLTLGLNAQGQQLQFKGRNTWYVYRLAAQILRNGQLVVDVPVSPAPPVYTVRSVLDTWLKTSSLQGSALSNNEKQLLSANTILPLSSYALVENDHLKLTLGQNAQGQQVQFKGRNTWYVYRPAVQILKDGQNINFVPTSNSSVTKAINAKGLRLLKNFEGLELTAYLDAVGVWTIGYGTTAGVVPGMQITETQAEALLKRDLARFEQAVADLVQVPLSSDQFSALVSFTYNVGEAALTYSTLLRLLNQGDYDGAANQFLRWNQGNNGELPGLTRRRKAERALFLGQDFTAFLQG